MIEEITKLWEAGHTMTEIARQLNITRNVVAGKIFRAKRDGIEMARRAAPVVRRPKVTGFNFTNQITRLKLNECRFILNDDTSNPVYCCKPIDRRSYCKTHADLCYMKPEKKRDRRTR